MSDFFNFPMWAVEKTAKAMPSPPKTLAELQDEAENSFVQETPAVEVSSHSEGRAPAVGGSPTPNLAVDNFIQSMADPFPYEKPAKRPGRPKGSKNKP